MAVFLAAGLVGLSFPAVLRAQGTIQGVVANGTTGRPQPSQEVVLLLPRGGMQRVASATTDANGHFAFPAANVDPASFYLVQAPYQGVDYNAPAHFEADGNAAVNITLYEASAVAPPLRIQSARVVVGIQDKKARVQEMFAVRNESNPPRSYLDPSGTFRFRLSDGAAQPSAAVAGLMNMPLPQPLKPGKGPGEYSLAGALKPGLTVVIVSYEADYSSNQLVLGDSIPYPLSSAELLVSPPGLEVASSLFKPAGTDSETGSDRYVAAGLGAEAKLEARLSGEAGGGEPAAAETGEPQVKVIPNPVTRLAVPMLACVLLLLGWALGVCLAKEWPRLKERGASGAAEKEFEATVGSLFDCLADLDELFAAGKVPEKHYWKERLDLKARLTTSLKKAPTSLLESYAIRHKLSR
jgi:hypothetical protein